VAEHELSISRATKAVGLSRAAWYRTLAADRARRDQPIIDALNELVEAHPTWGFWKCYDRLRLDGHRWNHKRMWRVYCAMKLNLPRRKKRRVPVREPQSLEVPARPNVIWSLDFMSDTLYGGRRFRTLNILDEGVREALKIVIDTSIPSGRLVRELDQLVTWRGRPEAIRCDNGPEICAQVFVDWCRYQGIEIRYIQPGKPNQNAFIERFNKTYRQEVLDAYLFRSLDEVRRLTTQWLTTYNEYRPHESLGRVPPAMFRRNLKPEISTYGLST
jgi:putative transposase